MKKIFLFFFLITFATPILSQEGFEFVKSNSKSVKIPAKIINNLVFIPVEVNGVHLLFLLDSGVEETIIFGFEDTQKLHLNHIEKINFKGFGGKEGVEGLKSSGNTLSIKGIQAKNHILYLITDPTFSLSGFVGFTVNGIIGHAAFRNHLVKLDYHKKIVTFYKPDSSFEKNIAKNYAKIPITVERKKPYINTLVKTDTTTVWAKLLIDTGNSDAIWLFDKLSDKIHLPKNNFNDYLGQGLSGNVEGKRGLINEFSIGDFKFNSPIVAFPDSLSIKNISIKSNRLGSLGGEILKRFSVVFDYTKKQLYLKKNKAYKSPFYYNKSGIEIWRSGEQWVKNMVIAHDNSIAFDLSKENVNLKYQMELKPVYEIGYIRENSNASNSGLKIGDIVVAVDGKEVYNHSLQEINSLLWSDDEIWIELKVQRLGKLMTFKFQLLNII